MVISHSIVTWQGLTFDLWIISMMVIVMLVISLTAWLISRKLCWIPKNWQSVLEIIVEFIENSVKDSLGKSGVKYSYFFGSLFLFILVSNMLGLVPGFASPTRDVSVTLGLAFLVVIWMQYIGIRENGFVNYLKHFLSPTPLFLPLHLMELVTRPLTLALRLFGNIYAGEILIEKLTETFYIVIPSVWLLMSVAIGAIQAYIFTVLSLAYTGLSIEHQNEE
ncbi:MAG TPA: F0F1 ATP synthase subunit A [Bacillota bacterium]|nr:F0F1 ATP synthase subunit A [Bacillota bacterium]